MKHCYFSKSKIKKKYKYFLKHRVRAKYNNLETLEIKRDWPMAAILVPMHFKEHMN